MLLQTAELQVLGTRHAQPFEWFYQPSCRVLRPSMGAFLSIPTRFQRRDYRHGAALSLPSYIRIWS